MIDTLGLADLARMLRRASAAVRAEQALLSQLDSHGGDGDHGSTMARAMDKLEEAVAAAADKTPAELLQDVGWGIMGADGGATGPLFGSLFMGMAEAVSDADLDASGLGAALEAGLAGVRRRTKADLGDKTMLDALVPAVSAYGKAVGEGLNPGDALARAATAAAAGAAATVDMQARFGRAKNLGEASRGHQDPGATSVALLFKGLHEGTREDELT